MASKSGKTRKSTSRKRTSVKARAKKRTTKKKPTTKARAKKRTTKKKPTTKARAKKRTTKRKPTTKARAKKRTAKRKPTTKARAKKRTTKRKPTTKARAKKRTAKRKPTTKAKAKKRTAKRKPITKAKAKKRTTKRKPITKAKASKKSTSVKAKAKRSAPRKKTTVKAKTSTKTVQAKKLAVKKTSPISPKSESSKTDFDFNKWLLPTLALEQFEPNVTPELGVLDHIEGSTRYAWIGAGQCGGRLVKSFYDQGYKKVLAVNTTHSDLDLLDIPESQKFLMDIGEKGAGKNLERGQQAAQQYLQEILHLARQTFGTEVDHIMLCFGAGGGTGSGSIVELVEIVKRYTRYIGLKNPDQSVGVMMTLPTVGEASSPVVAENAYRVANELGQMAAEGKISPLIIIDNEKINKMYPGMTVKSFWPSINNTVTTLFDIFNRVSALSSQYTSFDAGDYRSIMGCGGCTIMGLSKVTKFDNKFAISEAVKRNLEKTLLAGGFDLSTARRAGCIAVGGKKLMSNIKGLQDNIDYAFDNLSEITGKATIHRGIYEDNRDTLRVYTVIGGLEICASRLEELKSRIAVNV